MNFASVKIEKFCYQWNVHVSNRPGLSMNIDFDDTREHLLHSWA